MLGYYKKTLIASLMNMKGIRKGIILIIWTLPEFASLHTTQYYENETGNETCHITIDIIARLDFIVVDLSSLLYGYRSSGEI